MCENEITCSLRVAGSTSFHCCLVVARFAIRVEEPEPPAARSRILCRVLDLELNVCGGAGHEGLFVTKDVVVLRRRDILVVQTDDDRAVRKGELPFTVCLDSYVVAQNGRKAVKVARFVGRGDKLPVSVLRRNFGQVDWSGILLCLSGDGYR
jgi:hypothetical protein